MKPSPRPMSCSTPWSRGLPPRPARSEQGREKGRILSRPFSGRLKSGRLADLVDLGSALRAGSHRRRLAVLHGDWLGIPHFDLHLVFKAIPFHLGFLTSLHSRIQEAPPQPAVF